MMEEKHEKKKIYHEKQRLQFCLLHSLNNLLQDKDSFTRADLDAIASKLFIIDPNKGSWTPLSVIFKPHHNALTGNYDVNVLIAALEGKGKRVVWHDRRNAASSIDLSQSEETLIGIVLNVPVRRYAGLWKSRHWVAIRKIEGIWYNLDSDLAAPIPFQHEEEVKDFLDDVVGQGGEILIVLHGERKNLKRNYWVNPITFICVFVSVSCLLVLFVSVIGLPEISMDRNGVQSLRTLKFGKKLEEGRLGELGQMVVGMLPDDLAFTVFLPSEEAFRRDVKLQANESLVEQKFNDTFAILTRVLGFSTVPQHLPSIEMYMDKEMPLDSISGFRLYAVRTSSGALVVNNVQSKWLDIRKGKAIIHLMSGVIMDAEFGQSFQSDDNDEE
ncbi:hypothetical protein ACLOJK_012458 [Asimina triloba]